MSALWLWWRGGEDQHCGPFAAALSATMDSHCYNGYREHQHYLATAVVVLRQLALALLQTLRWRYCRGPDRAAVGAPLT